MPESKIRALKIKIAFVFGFRSVLGPLLSRVSSPGQILPASHPLTHVQLRSPSLGPVIASRATVALLKIQRRWDRTLVFAVSGRLDVENVGELCQLIDTEPASAVVVLDLADLVLADRDAVRYLRDCETFDRIVLRNCPAYIRAWMAAEDNH